MRSLQVNGLQPEPFILDEALAVLRGGGLLAFPTDTFYGLTCDPTNRDALEALFRLKERPESLRLPFIAADALQAAELVSVAGDLAGRLAARFWPGPLSLVLPLSRPDRLASWDWGTTLAIRVPALPVARELARRWGLPIPATSANRSGRTPLRRPEEMEPGLAAGLDLLLDGGTLPGGLPSTLVDPTSSPPRLIRSGAVSREQLASEPGLAALASPDD
jgi:L-threonylcarbamoyladenylate synthase